MTNINSLRRHVWNIGLKWLFHTQCIGITVYNKLRQNRSFSVTVQMEDTQVCLYVLFMKGNWACRRTSTVICLHSETSRLLLYKAMRSANSLQTRIPSLPSTFSLLPWRARRLISWSKNMRRVYLQEICVLLSVAKISYCHSIWHHRQSQANRKCYSWMCRFCCTAWGVTRAPHVRLYLSHRFSAHRTRGFSRLTF